MFVLSVGLQDNNFSKQA